MKHLSERAKRQAEAVQAKDAAIRLLQTGTPEQKLAAHVALESHLAEELAISNEPDIHECFKCGKEFSVDRANARIGCTEWIECDDTGRPTIEQRAPFLLAICDECLPAAKEYRGKR